MSVVDKTMTTEYCAYFSFSTHPFFSIGESCVHLKGGENTTAARTRAAVGFFTGFQYVFPRKVFFATYTPPQKTDLTFFAALRRRELCET